MTDDERETAILAAKLEHMSAATPEQRRAAWEKMRDFILGRSPQAVERLERELGLRDD